MRNKVIYFEFNFPINSIQKVGKKYVNSAIHQLIVTAETREKDEVFYTSISSIMFGEKDVLPLIEQTECSRLYNRIYDEATNQFHSIKTQNDEHNSLQASRPVKKVRKAKDPAGSGTALPQ
jgi:hypothetical protein